MARISYIQCDAINLESKACDSIVSKAVADAGWYTVIVSTADKGGCQYHICPIHKIFTLSLNDNLTKRNKKEE